MPGPAGFDATRMFQLADKAGELTEDMWEACGEPTTLKNARRAYKKYYEAKERHELNKRLEEELRPTPKKKKAGAHKPAAKSSDGGSSSRKRKEPESEAGSSSGGRAGVESTQTPVRKTSHQRERELECREEPSSSRGPADGYYETGIFNSSCRRSRRRHNTPPPPPPPPPPPSPPSHCRCTPTMTTKSCWGRVLGSTWALMLRVMSDAGRARGAVGMCRGLGGPPGGRGAPVRWVTWPRGLRDLNRASHPILHRSGTRLSAYVSVSGSVQQFRVHPCVPPEGSERVTLDNKRYTDAT